MVLGGLGAKDILIQLKGDNKDLKNAMKDSDISMGTFTDSVLKAGPAMAAAFAVGTAALISMAVKMAAAEEVVNRQTESMLKSQGIMWSGVKGEVTDYINELEKLTAYGDTDLQMAFNRMSSSGMDYTATMESMKMVTDIAYTRNIDLVAAADLVAKAYNGQASSLKRYGIIVGDGVTGLEALNAVQEQVNKNFADAADRTDTLEGKMALVNTQTDDAIEAFGNELIPVLTETGDIFVDLMGGAEDFGESLGKLATIGPRIIKETRQHIADQTAINKLVKSGVDTEAEWVNLLQLEGEELVNMTDEQFKYATGMLTQAGYHDKVLKVEKARLYGINMQNRALKEQEDLAAAILAIEEATTAEGEKQLAITKAINAATSRQKKAVRKGITAREYSEGQYGNWTQIRAHETAVAEGRPVTTPPSASKSGAP